MDRSWRGEVTKFEYYVLVGRGSGSRILAIVNRNVIMCTPLFLSSTSLVCSCMAASALGVRFLWYLVYSTEYILEGGAEKLNGLSIFCNICADFCIFCY